MTRLQDYTDQQSRVERAFCCGGACCSVHCEACDRIYFVTSSGHGDYDEGELDQLRAHAAEEPEKYVEVPDYSSVSTMTIPGGKHVVIGCLCDPTKPLSDFIEGYAEEITAYLREYWKATREEAANKERKAAEALAALGWSRMDCAPKDVTWVEVETTGGELCEAHWASDLSGEDQPPFRGWFTGDGRNGPFRQIHPIHWRPLKEEEKELK